MGLILGAISLLLFSGLGALMLNKTPRYATFVGVSGVIISCLLGLAAVTLNFINGQTVSFSLPLSIPYASFSLEIDLLSAFFLLPIFFLSALAAIYGAGYLKSWYGKKSIGTSWFFYNLLVASMAMVVIARNSMVFLFFWEMMTVASYFLVTFENEKSSVRKAGLMYLVASQLGTAFLLVLFILLGREAGSLDFNRFQISAGILPSVIFFLAIVGFGTKAGFMPFHIWLPEAHPAAPSHVSALMSGVMIKTGIYGLIRVLMFLGPPPAWWGGFLIVIGIICGILGVLFALAQHDLKRLLAYHSIENIGIITLGLGLGLLGMSIHSPVLMILGWAGGLLHVLNHALFKGLLFLGAGAVVHAAGTREIDCLGGLLKRMPSTGICFLIGSAAICGLPLLNGFVSEFLIYLGSFYGIGISASVFLAVLGIIAALAVIGGLAVACFSKAFGIIFLGEPRTSHGQDAHEFGWLMR
ncbi:MAG: proton-conducting transporter membrane subunit, partial [Candidatus Omnitrophica bacterium]|nr:proton-conducting transporter membrane subunit [Candidatus Omnitrophota bacterium]